MKLSYAQKPLIKPLVYSVLIGALFAGVYTQLDAMLAEMNQEAVAEQERVESLYQEVRRTLDKIELVKLYNQRFKAYSAKGLIGEQNRADWIDNFMEVISRHQVLHAKLNFSARVAVQASQLSMPINTQLTQYETINFEGSFQHENNVLAFLDDINKQVHELSLVQGCSFAAVEAGQDAAAKSFQFQQTTGNVVANCQFYLLEVAAGNQLPEAAQ